MLKKRPKPSTQTLNPQAPNTLYCILYVFKPYWVPWKIGFSVFFGSDSNDARPFAREEVAIFQRRPLFVGIWPSLRWKMVISARVRWSMTRSSLEKGAFGGWRCNFPSKGPGSLDFGPALVGK